MDNVNPLEDWRGVDVGQIRDLLKLSVAERSAEMVWACNVVLRIQENVKMARNRSLE